MAKHSMWNMNMPIGGEKKNGKQNKAKRTISRKSWPLAEFVIWANITHMNNFYTLEQRQLFI